MRTREDRRLGFLAGQARSHDDRPKGFGRHNGTALFTWRPKALETAIKADDSGLTAGVAGYVVDERGCDYALRRSARQRRRHKRVPARRCELAAGTW